MTLPASGAIAMGQVNAELNFSSVAQISLNDTAVRTLFGKASGAIAMSDGWGKSNAVFSAPVRTSGDAIMTAIARRASDGVTVAVGHTYSTYIGRFSRSTNGTTWTTPASINSYVWNSTPYTGVSVNSAGLFVAVVKDGYYTYYGYSYSPDGMNWTGPLQMNGSTVSASWEAIACSGAGLFVAVGTATGTYTAMSSHSANGTVWATPAAITGSSLNHPMAICVNSAGRFVAVGYNNYTYPTFIYSDNGIAWSTVALFNGYSTSGKGLSVAVNSAGRFVMVGGLGANGVTSYSDNGSTWSTPAKFNGAGNFQVQSVTVNTAGLFLAVGYDPSTSLPSFSISSDGATWSTPAAFGSTTQQIFYGVVSAGGGNFYTVGGDTTSMLTATYHNGSG